MFMHFDCVGLFLTIFCEGYLSCVEMFNLLLKSKEKTLDNLIINIQSSLLNLRILPIFLNIIKGNYFYF